VHTIYINENRLKTQHDNEINAAGAALIVLGWHDVGIGRWQDRL